jgi:tRNA(Ile)-lysidine synthetase-like protein
MNLEAQVRDYISTQRMLEAGERVVVGVSGGPDSLCLLNVLRALADDLKVGLIVAHLDHGLRPEAAEEAEFVRQQAQALGLLFHLGRADTRALAAAHRQSLEEAGRAARYGFLADVAADAGARKIAVAHTADDQAETVLMHFLRGSGLAGLKGMLPVVEASVWRSEVRRRTSDEGSSDFRPLTSDLYLIRPLLATTRAQVEAYCAARGLEPRRDESNADRRFLRNRLRHELLPLLETYNPQVRAVLARSAAVLAGEHALVQAHLEEVWRATARLERQTEGRVVFDRERWRALSVPEQRALLRRAVQVLRRQLRDVDFTPLEAAVRFSRAAQPGRQTDLLAGLCLAVGAEAIIVQPWGRRADPGAHSGPLLSADGSLDAGWEFSVEAVTSEEWGLGEPMPAGASRWTEYVDASALDQPLCLRARRPGDRFQPLGLGGHSTKVSDFMVNQKVAAAMRDRWPLVVAGGQVVWVAGLRLDDRFKVRPETERLLRLRFWEV